MYYNITSVLAAEIHVIRSLSLSVKIWRDSYSLHIRLSWLSQVSRLRMSSSFKKFHLWSHNVYSLFLSPTFYSSYLTSNFTILNSLLADPCKSTIPFNALGYGLIWIYYLIQHDYERSIDEVGIRQAFKWVRLVLKHLPIHFTWLKTTLKNTRLLKINLIGDSISLHNAPFFFLPHATIDSLSYFWATKGGCLLINTRVEVSY